jgi:WD40 repeat protein/Ca2+-binding EF-hand superfamily protein
VRELERAMRAEIKAMHSVSKSGRERLVDALKEYDYGNGGEVTWIDFQDAWRALGLELTEAECRAFASRNGADAAGDFIDVGAFVESVSRGPARAQAEAPVCKGYPVTDDDFAKKIVYPRCRKGVLAPSDFTPALADRSTMEPDARLELNFVYGYDGVVANAPNLFYVNAGTRTSVSVAYFAAAVGVVYDDKRDKQSHFLGHTNDITCMAICEAEVTHREVRYPENALIATGQKKALEDHDNEEIVTPYVSVWDARTCTEAARVRLPRDARQVAACAFSPDGRLLVTVGCDNSHTVMVWDWRVAHCAALTGARGKRGKPAGLIAQGAGFKERPVGVFGVKFDPWAHPGRARFATYGKKHLKVWTCDANDESEWRSVAQSFGEFGVDDVAAVEFLCPPGFGEYEDDFENEDGAEDSRSGGGGGGEWFGRFGRDDESVKEPPEGAIVTGMPDGSLLVWREGRAVRRVKAHGRGKKTIQPDGSVAFGGGVRALRLRDDGLTLLTGGADGVVMSWDARENTIGDVVCEPTKLESTATASGADSIPAIRSIDCHPGSDVFVVGTDKCDVWEVDGINARVIMKAPAPLGNLRGACWHHGTPNVFITAAGSGDVFWWDAANTVVARGTNVGFTARTVACTHNALAPFMSMADRAQARADGTLPDRSHHVAIGGGGGELCVLDERDLRVVFHDCARKAGVEDVKYSPDDTKLAVSSRDAMIDVYAVRGKNETYQRVFRLRGHSAAVRHVDWSVDSRALGSDGADYELLHWDASTGKQLTSATNDVRWHTWTRVLGFPVMGLWPPGSDGTDVNAASRDPKGELLATADDAGVVKLFAYPCVVEDAPHRRSVGHASHVMGVAFSPCGNRLLSVGGTDRCVFQYDVVRKPPPPPRAASPEKEWLPMDAKNKTYGWRRPDVPPSELYER